MCVCVHFCVSRPSAAMNVEGGCWAPVALWIGAAFTTKHIYYWRPTPQAVRLHDDLDTLPPSTILRIEALRRSEGPQRVFVVTTSSPHMCYSRRATTTAARTTRAVNRSACSGVRTRLYPSVEGARL